MEVPQPGDLTPPSVDPSELPPPVPVRASLVLASPPLVLASPPLVLASPPLVLASPPLVLASPELVFEPPLLVLEPPEPFPAPPELLGWLPEAPELPEAPPEPLPEPPELPFETVELWPAPPGLLGWLPEAPELPPSPPVVPPWEESESDDEQAKAPAKKPRPTAEQTSDRMGRMRASSLFHCGRPAASIGQDRTLWANLPQTGGAA
jgi:hypothetical protein